MHNEPEETLDPEDWDQARATAHRMVDVAIDHMQSLRDRPAWQEMPAQVRQRYQTGLPRDPASLEDVCTELEDYLLPYTMGNKHPRFWGWYMGAGNFTGALGDFLAGIDGSNLGGGNTAAAQLDSQVVGWMKEIVDFPETATGTLTSGGSNANLVALTVARNVMAGPNIRERGITDLAKPIRFYTSDQAHSCHQKAIEIMGLGSRSLRYIATNAELEMDVDALRAAIQDDIAQGFQPVCVIAAAGTTNTGAIDDIGAIHAVCKEFDLWFHVDGCIGALLKIAPANRHRVAGLEQADSVSLDPHKWLHTPFEAGCVLVRHPDHQFNTFEMHGEYLQIQERGVASGEFLADYGLELSRGFKALKIWMSLTEQGIEKFGRLIDQNIEQGRYLSDRIAQEPSLQQVAPRPINIVCFRHVGAGGSEEVLKNRNIEIMLRIQESGLAVPSDTTVQGVHCLRVAINNHRTRMEDLDLLVDEVVRIGAILEAAEDA